MKIDLEQRLRRINKQIKIMAEQRRRRAVRYLLKSARKGFNLDIAVQTDDTLHLGLSRWVSYEDRHRLQQLGDSQRTNFKNPGDIVARHKAHQKPVKAPLSNKGGLHG